MDTFREFIDTFHLWQDPMIVGLFAGMVCGVIGVYVVLRRMVFVSATLTQISGVGVVTAFLLQAKLTGWLAHAIDPFMFTIIVTCIAAVLFSVKKGFFPITLEGVIGFAFLLSGALIIILADMTPHGLQEIDNVLFGSAVVVDSTDRLFVPLIAVSALIIHLVLYKDFIFISYDPDMAKISRYPLRILNTVLFITLGVVVAVSTRALGALPVFALLVLPALTSLYLTERLKYVFLCSAVLGVLSTSVGYYISYAFEFPTGASMVLFSSILFLAGLFITLLRKIAAYAVT